MRQYPRPALLQIMAYRIFENKPLSEPMMAYLELDNWGKNFIEYWIEINSFH